MDEWYVKSTVCGVHAHIAYICFICSSKKKGWMMITVIDSIHPTKYCFEYCGESKSNGQEIDEKKRKRDLLP